MRHCVYLRSSMARAFFRAPFRIDRRYTSIINYFRKLKDFDRPLSENVLAEYVLHIADILQTWFAILVREIRRFLFSPHGIQNASKTTITHFPAGTRSFILWNFMEHSFALSKTDFQSHSFRAPPQLHEPFHNAVAGLMMAAG